MRKRVVCVLLLMIFLLAGCSSQTGMILEEVVNDAESPTVRYSHQSGIYSSKRLKITLTAPEGYTIAYTTDASTPGIEDDSGKSRVNVSLSRRTSGYLIDHKELMSLPVLNRVQFQDDSSLPFGCVLRTVLVGPDGITGDVRTEVFFLGDDFTEKYPDCLVLSVVADPDDLLNYDTGILAAGSVYDSWRTTETAQAAIREGKDWEYEANFTQRGKAWERPCLVQIYDGGNAPTVEQEAGLRVSGHASRMRNQKSFNFYFRKEYGSKYLEFELFDGISRYRSFQMKNGGNSADYIKFKGTMLQDLVSDREFMTSLSCPAVLFLNGEYWGPYLLTEKISDDMISDHYGVDPDQVIVIKQAEVEEGTDEDLVLYQELMSYADKDMTDPMVWDEFRRMMNIQSFADYCATRIYIGDDDWDLEKNDILWRTRDSSFDDGRWQYILYDVEYSAGLYGSTRTAPDTDHFRLALERYPLFASAIRNKEFYDLFLDSIKEIGSGNYYADRVKETMNAYADIWKPLMPDYYKRFGDTSHLWTSDWDATIRFFETRYDYIIPCVESYAESERTYSPTPLPSSVTLQW